LNRFGILRLAQQFVPTRVAILRYHSVQEDPARFEHSIGAAIIHTSRCFSEQMELLARRYNPVTLDDVLLFLRGEKRLPRRAVAVTFDDGFLDNFEVAAPIMNRLGIPGTFYVTVAAIAAERPLWFCRLRHAFGMTRGARFQIAGDDRVHDLELPQGRRSGFLAASATCATRSGPALAETIRSIEEALCVEPLANAGLMMSWDQVRALCRSGHPVGSHTLTHPNLAQIPESEADHELRESRRILESHIGKEVIHVSYPNSILKPYWTTKTCEIAARAGYLTAVTSESGGVAARDLPLSLRRVAVPHYLEEFKWVVDCALIGRRV
jgi:peptidoglycan/xylan/chitin deacetylase (PgdA/CDA1 family)